MAEAEAEEEMMMRMMCGSGGNEMMKTKMKKKNREGEEEEEVSGGGRMRKGPWTEQEDVQLVWFVRLFGERRWDFLAKVSGLRGGG